MPSAPSSFQILDTLLQWVLVVGALALLWRGLRRRWSPRRTALVFRVVLVGVLWSASATVVLHVFAEKWGLGGDHRGRGLETMLEHEAQKPFVYRYLTPEIVRRLADAIEARIEPDERDWWLRRLQTRRYAAPKERWTVAKSVQFHVVYAVLFVSLVLAQVGAFALVADARAPPLARDFAPAVALLLLPLTFVRTGYLYDFPELAFLFLSVAAIWRGWWFAYYPLLVLACLNKESNALLPLYFVAFARFRMPTRQWVAHAAVQAGLAAAVVVGVRIAFRDAPGSSQWFLLPLNLWYLSDLRIYAQFHTAYGGLAPFPGPLNALLLFATVFAVAWRWREKPAPVRSAVVLVFAALIPIYLCFGFLDEVRALSVGFPALYLAGFHTVVGLYGRELAAPPAAEPAA